MKLTREDKEALAQYRATIAHLKMAGVGRPEAMVSPPLLSCEKTCRPEWPYMQGGREWANRIIIEATT